MSKTSGKRKSIIALIISLAMLYSIYCSNEANNQSNYIGDLQNKKLEDIVKRYSVVNLDVSAFSVLVSSVKDSDKENLDITDINVITVPLNEQIQNITDAYDSEIDQVEKTRDGYYFKSQIFIAIAFILTFVSSILENKTNEHRI